MSRTVHPEKPKHRCPACGARAGVPIVYGLATPEMFDDPDIVLGGCVVGPGSADVACRACGHEWRHDDP